FTEKEPVLDENYGEILDFLSPTNSEILKTVRSAILTILNMHGLGYEELVYKKLVEAEFAYLYLSFTPQILIPVKFNEKTVRYFKLETPVVANTILCKIVSQRKEITSEISKIRTYLTDAYIPIGLLIHFGKEKLEIIAIHR
ncbi:MAG: GxxExxY protein, partial [Bacteroidota bacterium]